jgi:hypothetical protein
MAANTDSSAAVSALIPERSHANAEPSGSRLRLLQPFRKARKSKIRQHRDDLELRDSLLQQFEALGRKDRSVGR